MTGRFIHEKVAALSLGLVEPAKATSLKPSAMSQFKFDIRHNHEVLFSTATQLFASLYAARANDTYARRFKALSQVDLLIVDDFGLKPLGSPADEDLHDLIAERYERKATVITSNLDFDEWGNAFPNKLLGAAALDRLKHSAYRLILDGESYRQPRPM